MMDPRVILAQAAKTGDYSHAEHTFRSILSKNPRDLDTAQWLGVVLRLQGKTLDALALHEKVASARPQSVPAQVEYGLSLHQAGRVDSAVTAYQSALALQPQNPIALMHLGRAHLDLFNPGEAIRVFKEALKVQPANFEVMALLAQAYLSRGLPVEAVKLFRQLLGVRPGNARLMCSLAAALRLVGEDDEALGLLEKAAGIDPSLSGAIAGQVQLLESRKEYGRADALLDAALHRGLRSADIVEAFARQAKRTGRQDEAIAMLQPLVASDKVPPYVRSMLSIAMGELLESQKNYPAAFAAYRAGNELFPRTFSNEQLHGTIEKMLTMYSADKLRTYARSGSTSELPFYIVGMPRSGTSLVEQILASHPNVHGAGELNHIATMQLTAQRRFGLKEKHPLNAGEFTAKILDELAAEEIATLRGMASEAGFDKRGTELTRVTDKMPGNYHALGFISRLFPKTRVIYCRRHPMDNCLSCYTTSLSPLHSYANDPVNVAETYKQHLRLMAHWRAINVLPILEVRYESLVADPEPIVRQMLEFAGLSWDDACMRHHETQRVVHTASMDQARKPIYKSSVARWKRFEEFLGPMRQALGTVVDDWEAEMTAASGV